MTAAASGGPGNRLTRERRRWIVAVIIAFVLGFLLAWRLPQTMMRNCRISEPDDGKKQQMHGSSGMHGAPDKGAPVKLGAPDDGDSNRKPGGGDATAGGGGGGGGKGRAGDGGGGPGTPWKADGDGENHGSGNSHADESSGGGPDGDKDFKGGGDGDVKPSPPAEKYVANAQQGTGPPAALGGGTAEGAAEPPKPVAASAGTPGPDALVAKDLRYDKSELPHYPNATQSASGAPALNGPKPSDPNISIATIMTKDDLPTVAAWYHQQLPDWSEQNLGQMVTFWPPDRKADPRTVWLVIDPKTGQTGAILWKAKKNVAP
ncbi:MAG TPA: hypothetical protein VFO44_07605 [Steroidobacteraceae bacterium]|nr:hypothetical protein [Steroidobacteraceae bacterium]